MNETSLKCHFFGFHVCLWDNSFADPNKTYHLTKKQLRQYAKLEVEKLFNEQKQAGAFTSTAVEAGKRVAEELKQGTYIDPGMK